MAKRQGRRRHGLIADAANFQDESAPPGDGPLKHEDRRRLHRRAAEAAIAGDLDFRPVVCVDTGVAYESVKRLVQRFHKLRERTLSEHLILGAIEMGREYAGTHWDWRYPKNWDEAAMWERIRLREERQKTSREEGDSG